MRSTRTLYVYIFSLLITFFCVNTIVRAADDDGDDYDVKARVVRISLINGAVTLKRKGNTDWERARANFPLVEGDTLGTDRNSRVEIQIDSRNFIRLGESSVLKVVTLRDEGVALSLVEGTASARLTRFNRDHEYFEIDAPKITLAAENRGLYRIDVVRDGHVRLTVRDGGRARIYSETSGFALRDGRTAELVYDGPDAGDWQLLAAPSRDSWDNWVDDRERYLAQRSHYDVQYYDNYVWGAEDLDAYGDWNYINDYGWIWRPHITVINNYNNWVPYRYGNWTWCPPYGWTWVGDEPWGWAPYHYGRWVYYNNYWAWCPHSQYYRDRSWWRPALVAFVSIHLSFGENICWYPLSYHQRDPHSRYYRAANHLNPLRANELASLRHVNPGSLHAVTALPARDFGGDRARLRPADDALAQRVVRSEPLRSDLPIRPANAVPSGVAAGGRSEPVTIARRDRVTPAVQVPERPTGAATRMPGVPLDQELRRTRVLNGREPRSAAPAEANLPVTIEARPTGAITRPERPVQEPRNRRSESNLGIDQNARPVDRPARPERAEQPERTEWPERVDRPARPERTEQPERTERPERVDRPARPERTEGPERTERPERVDRPARPERTEQPDRTERPERVDRPARSERAEQPQRTERPERSGAESPVQHSAPPVRTYEPPARSESTPRHEPPPQRSEPSPRSERPPQQSDPPPQHSQPQTQRSEPAKPNPDRPARGGRKEDP